MQERGGISGVRLEYKEKVGYRLPTGTKDGQGALGLCVGGFFLCYNGE